MFANFLEQNDLHAMLRLGLPYPKGADRTAWEGIPMGERLLADAEEAAQSSYPLLTALDFLAYARTGDRQAYQEPYFARRHHLIRTAVGECLQWNGAFLDDVITGLWLLAEETSWVVSAHNVDSHPGGASPAQRPLPDKQNPVIDLFAAQTAATVTLCCHLLQAKLDEVTPLIHRRMKEEVEERILRPFFQRDDFWWMGMIRSDVNNWTPWILSGVLTCLFYWETDPWRLSEGVSRAMKMLDRYLAVTPQDGGCDEGAGYWNMSGASLLDCLELIRYATGGKADFYNEPLIRAMAAFPARAHIQGPYFWNFADCDAMPMLDGERVWRFGARTHQDSVKALGAELMEREQSPWPKDTPQMSRVLDRLFCEAVPAAYSQQAKALETAEKVEVLPDLQVWACRKGAYYAAVKGGHNGENHNHNDVGSFLLYLDGKPAVIDAGNMTYTGKTFSSERYTLWNTRSRNHNVPMIGGYEQCAGAEYKAEAVQMDDQGTRMELKSCYPTESGLASFVRCVELDAKGFHLRDRISLEQPSTVEWVFLLGEEPSLLPGACTAGALRMSFPPALRWASDAYPVSDARMKKNFPGRIWRLSLTAEASRTHDVEFLMEEHNE